MGAACIWAEFSGYHRTLEEHGFYTTAMEFDEDEWMLQSFARYEQLFMYELQPPAAWLECADGNGVYVVGGGCGQCELSLLQLPEKLTQDDDENLAARRDFTIVCGAIAPHSAFSLKYLPTQCVLAVSDGNSVHIWKRENEESDLMIESGAIHHCSDKTTKHITGSFHFLDWSSSSPNALLSTNVSSSTPVQLLDVTTGNKLWQLDAGEGLVQGACYASPHSVLVCVGPGTLQLTDTRTPGSTCSTNGDMSSLPPSTAKGDQYSIAVSSLTHQAATLSSSTGVVSLYDLRSTLKQPTVTISIQRTNNKAHPHRPHLQFSPRVPDLLSVSGVDHGVSIYSTRCDEPTTALDHAPVFTHDGHEALSATDHVLHHCWHSLNPSLLLSSASDGSLHAWQYIKS